ncbi:MAG: hypothetical protein QUS07_02515 [Methanothrix sp.]|nr:hypothetical protein [Methanothrix sp.]
MGEIDTITEREEMVRFLDGYSGQRKDELDERKAKRPLVKSYLLEHTRDCEGSRKTSLPEVFAHRALRLESLEDGNLWRIYDERQGDYFGFVEAFSDRYLAVYTIKEVEESDRWVRALVLQTPELDHFWISGLTFNQLWRTVVKLNHPSRYARIVFLHNSIYEIDDADTETDEQTDGTEDTDSPVLVERRAAKFSLVDRISVVNEKLHRLQKIYSPLYAISQLRFPSATGRGGHDFYDNGKVTNRSDSFRDHRSHLLYVQRIYERLTDATEERAWFSVRTEIQAPGEFQRLVGAPVVIQFPEGLGESTFEQWVTSTFDRPSNRFRLWGNPVRMGPGKYHVYGVDRHLWQPIFLEITRHHLVAIVPQGTCGNTIHRLVTNVQRFLDPAAKAFIGDKPYQDMVKESMVGVSYDPGK